MSVLIKRECLECGYEFETELYKAGRKKEYCSTGCARIGRDKRLSDIGACVVCGDALAMGGDKKCEECSGGDSSGVELTSCSVDTFVFSDSGIVARAVKYDVDRLKRRG